MNDNPLLALKTFGQHVWLDNLSRALLREGTLPRLLSEDGVDGVTSNPAIFLKAIVGSADYCDDLQRLHRAKLPAEACYESLVIADIQAACDILDSAYRSSSGETGYVSLEVSPALAHDTAATVAAAHRLSKAVGRDNLLVKVPATPAGIRAFEQLTAAGIRVNVTLIFSLAQYEAVAQAYLHGAQRRLDGGGNVKQLRSVASVFLSRVDTLVDQRLDAIGTALALKGGTAVALAKRCYWRYREIFHGPEFAALAKAGVRPQTPLWASTGTKNPAYSDVLYVEPLIGAETINTLPDATLSAFRSHGVATASLTNGMDGAQVHAQALAALGIDLTEVGENLQVEGVRLFAAAYAKILASLEP
jgi:transaldolase